MLNSLRIGAAAIAVAGALAACSNAPMQARANDPNVVPYDQLGLYNSYYGNAYAEQRPFRSKCDDLTNYSQRVECMRGEVDRLSRDKDGYWNGNS